MHTLLQHHLHCSTEQSINSHHHFVLTEKGCCLITVERNEWMGEGEGRKTCMCMYRRGFQLTPLYAMMHLLWCFLAVWRSFCPFRIALLALSTFFSILSIPSPWSITNTFKSQNI